MRFLFHRSFAGPEIVRDCKCEILPTNPSIKVLTQVQMRVLTTEFPIKVLMRVLTTNLTVLAEFTLNGLVLFDLVCFRLFCASARLLIHQKSLLRGGYQMVVLLCWVSPF